MSAALALSALNRHLFWGSGKFFYSGQSVLVRNWSFGCILTSALSDLLLLQGALWYMVSKQNLGLKLHSYHSLILCTCQLPWHKNELNLSTAAYVLGVLCLHRSQSKATSAFDS